MGESSVSGYWKYGLGFCRYDTGLVGVFSAWDAMTGRICKRMASERGVTEDEYNCFLGGMAIG